jgi:hypothetical protein
MNTGRCFRLNSVGALIWEMLATPRELQEISGAIAGQYLASIQEIESGLRDLISHLAKERLIETTLEENLP